MEKLHNYINGELVGPISRGYFDNVTPVTGEIYSQIPDSDSSDIDLAVAAALVSSITDVPVPAKLVVFGEIGLSGEVRPVSQSSARLKEAQKLGFNGAITPKTHPGLAPNKNETSSSLNVIRIKHLEQLLDFIRIEGEKNLSINAKNFFTFKRIFCCCFFIS